VHSDRRFQKTYILLGIAPCGHVQSPLKSLPLVFRLVKTGFLITAPFALVLKEIGQCVARRHALRVRVLLFQAVKSVKLCQEDPTLTLAVLNLIAVCRLVLLVVVFHRLVICSVVLSLHES